MSALRVDVENAANIVVHDVGDKSEKEDQADLDEALLESEAEVATANAFKSEQENVATIEDGDRKKIQNAQVDTDESHERDDEE